MLVFSLDFLALLLTGVLLGGMLFYSTCVTPMIFAKLPPDMAGRFTRQIFPVYYMIGTGLALLAALIHAWSIAGLILAVTGVGFLYALLWLMPAINRNRDRGVAGDHIAMATFEGLHKTSVALNTAQMLAVLVAFALLAGRLARY